MSLTSFVGEKDVVERLKPFRPRGGTVKLPLLVEPRGTSPQLIGTAFDYLLRFEIQRRAPHATDTDWVAEQVPDRIFRRTANGSVARELFPVDSEHYLPPQELSRRTRTILDEARKVHGEYVRESSPDPNRKRRLATVAVKLAKLDAVVRANKLDPAFETVADQDVEKLVALLDVVPLDRLLRPGRVLLNPTFGEASQSVGGADADLISGDLLVDFKTTKSAELKGETLNQLLGYFLLARRVRRTDLEMPEIRSVGVYFSRFAHLWAYDTAGWTGRPDFAALEEWFFKRAGCS